MILIVSTNGLKLNERERKVLAKNHKLLRLVDAAIHEEIGSDYSCAQGDAWRGFFTGALGEPCRMNFGDFPVWWSIGKRLAED
jgi:hypothetical protein